MQPVPFSNTNPHGLENSIISTSIKIDTAIVGLQSCNNKPKACGCHRLFSHIKNNETH